MSTYTDILDILRSHPLVKQLLPDNLIDHKSEIIHFEKIEYGGLSGGEKTLLSWIYCLWTDEKPPENWRDPLETFGILDQHLQILILKAIARKYEIPITFKR